MNIKERIENIKPYFKNMSMASENNIIYIGVMFPKGWGCSELTEYNFDVKAVKDEIPGLFYFFTNMENGFDKLFDAIEYNIKFNEDAQAKVNLLKEKIEELKTLFENEDINVLKTLEFKYKKKKTRISKKVNNNVIENSDNEEVNSENKDEQ